jgi:glycosyltransferase involved in cell wall biosynthesis
MNPGDRDLAILFIATLPPPITGQSIASSAFYDDLVAGGFRVRIVNLSKRSLSSGFHSVWRIIEILGILAKVVAGRKSTSHCYFTVAESVAGNLKDLLVYLCLLGRLDTTYVHLHGGAGMQSLLSRRHPFLRRINGMFLKRLAGVIVLGGRLEPIYANLVPRQRIYIVQNFAPTDTFITFTELRRKLDSGGPIRVLYLSNLLPEKGYSDLLAAVRSLPSSILNRLHVDFAGGFETEFAQRAFLNAIEDMPQIKFHGIVQGEAKKQLLNRAHIFCLPTYYPYEGQPISILEAYASGCSVLTTDHSGIYDIFTPGINGLSVEKKSPQSIAASITTLATDPRQLRRYCVVNARTARREYRLEKHLQKLRAVLRLNSQ